MGPKLCLDSDPGTLRFGLARLRLAQDFFPQLDAVPALPRNPALDRVAASSAHRLHDRSWLCLGCDRRQPVLQSVKSCRVSGNPDVADRMAAGRYRFVCGWNFVKETLARLKSPRFS